MTFTNLQVDLDDLPAFDSVDYRPLDRRYAPIVLAVTIAVLLPLLLAAAVVLFGAADADRGVAASLYLLAVLLAALLAWFSYCSARVVRFAVREHDVIVRTGLFWRKETVQPIRRIQHVEQHQGPIDKRFGLYELKLFSAGTGHFTFRIPGLDAEAASRIRRFILDAHQDGWAGEPEPAHAEAVVAPPPGGTSPDGSD